MPKHLLFAVLLLSLTNVAKAATTPCDNFCHPFYAGITAGYGSTTWEGLVPAESKQNIAMTMSTPINVDEGGAVYGLFAGYEFTPFFAIEASYMRYPNARVAFDPDSIYTFDNDGLEYLDTHTDSLSLMGKIMLIIPRTKVRAYSSTGIAVTHRWDNINDHRRGTPTFGIGLNYNLTEHIMAEFGGNYTAGFGESELQPVNNYMPFLYSGFLRLAYRI